RVRCPPARSSGARPPCTRTPTRASACPHGAVGLNPAALVHHRARLRGHAEPVPDVPAQAGGALSQSLAVQGRGVLNQMEVTLKSVKFTLCAVLALLACGVARAAPPASTAHIDG